MKNRSFSRLLSALTLVVWSAVLLYFYFSGRINEYLVGAYRPFVAIAGFLMLGLAALMFVGLRRGTNVTLPVLDELALPSRSRAMQVFAFLVLVLPVASAVAVSSDSFSSSVVQHRGLVTDGSNLPGGRVPAAPAANSVAEPPLPGQSPAADPNADSKLDISQYLQTSPDGNLMLSVFDLLMAAPDDSLRPDFEGRNVELIGQYLPDTRNHADGSRFNLVRMYMVCCAADARPIAVSIEPPKTTASATTAASTYKPADMAWVKIIGKVEFPLENGTRTAVVHAQSVAPSDPPAEVMLY